MVRYRFHLVNVFAETVLSGNALCVFEDARGLSDAQMQGLALQFNLSETTFVLPSSAATARVRIFTPSFEMPFAGHPTLGTAHVVRGLGTAGDSLSLEMVAGVIPVTAEGDTWTLEARAPQARPAEASRPQIAQMLGIEEREVLERAMWIDTGSEQLVIPLASPDAVERCRPSPELLAQHGSNGRREGLAYVWSSRGGDDVTARFFFLKQGSLVEDSGTGSACANLGGWLVTSGAALPVTRVVHQGARTGRPCRLHLRVDAGGRIFVTGRVFSLGVGEIALP